MKKKELKAVFDKQVVAPTRLTDKIIKALIAANPSLNLGSISWGMSAPPDPIMYTNITLNNPQLSWNAVENIARTLSSYGITYSIQTNASNQPTSMEFSAHALTEADTLINFSQQITAIFPQFLTNRNVPGASKVQLFSIIGNEAYPGIKITHIDQLSSTMKSQLESVLQDEGIKYTIKDGNIIIPLNDTVLYQGRDVELPNLKSIPVSEYKEKFEVAHRPQAIVQPHSSESQDKKEQNIVLESLPEDKSAEDQGNEPDPFSWN